jgi:hypothetical protein
LLLAFGFGFLAQRMLNPASFLQIALFKLGALFAFQTQPRITQSGVDFTLDSLPIYFLALAHYSPFFRAHLHPPLGIPLKYLSILRGHRDPSIARIVEIRDVSRRRQSSAIPALRLCLRQFCAQEQHRDDRDSVYNV